MFLEKLQNCGVPEGYPVRLECRVVGMPPPVFYWKKDNETIPSNRERMRYCTTTPRTCGWTNCFHENLWDKYRWWCLRTASSTHIKLQKSCFPLEWTQAVSLVQNKGITPQCLREWGQSLRATGLTECMDLLIEHTLIQYFNAFQHLILSHLFFPSLVPTRYEFRLRRVSVPQSIGY